MTCACMLNLGVEMNIEQRPTLSEEQHFEEHRNISNQCGKLISYLRLNFLANVVLIVALVWFGLVVLFS